jgi:riboflavin biosynthesis pyrimidine reductase
VIAERTRGDISVCAGAPIKKDTTHSEHSMFFFTHVSQSMIMSHTIEIGTDNFYLVQGRIMSVRATIVAGIDGSTCIAGSSSQVTSTADRSIFLERRRKADCIIIGGNTARNEPYAKTPVPLVVISRKEHPNLPAAHVWNLDPHEGVIKATHEFGENILIEGGAAFITYLLERNAVEFLELSVTAARGGTDIFDFERFLKQADVVIKNVLNDTTFYTATFKMQK